MSRTIRHPNRYIWDEEKIYYKTMDTKRWYKPKSWFKIMNRKIERAKAKNALRHEEDAPRVRKTDEWNWN